MPVQDSRTTGALDAHTPGRSALAVDDRFDDLEVLAPPSAILLNTPNETSEGQFRSPRFRRKAAKLSNT